MRSGDKVQLTGEVQAVFSDGHVDVTLDTGWPGRLSTTVRVVGKALKVIQPQVCVGDHITWASGEVIWKVVAERDGYVWLQVSKGNAVPAAGLIKKLDALEGLRIISPAEVAG
jgi:hypothetical protein